MVSCGDISRGFIPGVPPWNISQGILQGPHNQGLSQFPWLESTWRVATPPDWDATALQITHSPFPLPGISSGFPGNLPQPIYSPRVGGGGRGTMHIFNLN